MRQLKTKAVVLSRHNYREADRIITVLTPDYGKLSLIAKGSRAMKSKLAGGIELFTVNDISFIRGKGEVSTLTSGRLDLNHPNVIKDINRVQLGYELLKTIDHATEDEAEADYFHLLVAALGGLDDLDLDPMLVKLWFLSRLMSISGHRPNLDTDKTGAKLSEDFTYGFDSDDMAFFYQPDGRFQPDHIKLLRIACSSDSPLVMGRIKGSLELAREVLPLVGTLHSTHI